MFLFRNSFFNSVPSSSFGLDRSNLTDMVRSCIYRWFILRLTKGPGRRRMVQAGWRIAGAVVPGRSRLVSATKVSHVASVPQTCIVTVPGRLFVARRSPPALHRPLLLHCCYGNDLAFLLGELTYPSFAYIPPLI